MKKKNHVISLSVLSGVCALGVVGFGSISSSIDITPQNVMAANEEVINETLETDIDIDDLIPKANRPEGVTTRELGATYWPPNYTYTAVSRFYDNVDQVGTASVWTRKWEQHKQYFIYQWGAANDAYDVGLKVRYYTLEGEDILNENGDKFDDFVKNNTFTDNGMVLRYHKVNDYVWQNYSSTGFQMDIELFDTVLGSDQYAYHLFGGFKANQTLSDVERELSDFISEKLPSMEGNFEPDIISRIRNHYVYNSSLSSVSTVPTIYGDFENYENFKNSWFYDYAYEALDGSANDKHFDKVISQSEYRENNNNMPFNQEGAGFFKGWYGGDQGEDSGFVASDAYRYRYRSLPYKLNEGEHYVSIKMAGKASLHILDAATHAELAFIDNIVAFNDWAPNYSIHLGFNTCTLRRYVINLSAYAGRTVEFAIADRDHGGWSAAYFDDFNCDWKPSNGFKVDEVVQIYGDDTTTDGKHYTGFTDIYINSEIRTDENPSGIIYKDGAFTYADSSDVRAAAEFVSEYYTVVRGNKGLNGCSSITSNEMKDVLNKYVSLPANVKAIVDASDDYQQIAKKEDPTDKWYANEVKIAALSGIIQYYCRYAGIYAGGNPLFNQFGIRMDSTTNIVVVPVICVTVIIALALYFVIKKSKKAKNK